MLDASHHLYQEDSRYLITLSGVVRFEVDEELMTTPQTSSLIPMLKRILIKIVTVLTGRNF